MPFRSDDIAERIKAFIKPAYCKILNMLSAEWHVSIDYLRAHHRLPNLKNPRTFSEKIVWRKLYDQDPRLPELVDKIRVKEIMAEKFGEDFIIPTLCVYNTAEELDFTQPPLSHPPYVLKVNHGSGTNIIVRLGDRIDPQKIKKELAKALKLDHAAISREWAYSLVPRKIFVEPYLTVSGGDITDYKFHTFLGKVYVIDVVSDRFTNYGVSFYDRNWTLLDIAYAGSAGRRYPRYKGTLKPPARLAEMIERAESIGRDFSYVRVDLYQIDNVIKLGELTFYPSAGHDPFHPREWDYKFGAQWALPYASKAVRPAAGQTPPGSSDIQRIDFLGLPLDIGLTIEGICQELQHKGTLRLIAYISPSSWAVAQKNPQYLVAMRQMSIIRAGGEGVARLCRWMAGLPCPRISFDMTSLADPFFKAAVAEKVSVMLVGGDAAVGENMQKKLKVFYPELNVIGTTDGYGGFDPKIATIMAASPDVLIIGMGSPRQELFLLALRDLGYQGIAITCGGFFDQYLESSQYYPEWIDRWNLRFAWRLYKEPRRLWRRYLIDYTLFLLRALRAVVDKILGLPNG